MLDHCVPLVQNGKCRVHIEAIEEIETKLKEMTVQDIITSKVEPTHWVSCLTYLYKANGTPRVCLDPKDLNKAIIDKHLKVSMLEGITHKLAGSTTHSKLNAKMVLELTTFNTHKGKILLVMHAIWPQDVPRCFPNENGQDNREMSCCHMCPWQSMCVWKVRKRNTAAVNLATNSLALNSTKCHIKCPQITF